MKPAPFEYRAPRSLEEALSHLASEGDEAKILAGGQSLIPVMNFRLAQPAILIDINRVPYLDGIAIDAENNLRLGALVRHITLERDPTVARHAPLLAAAIPSIAHAQIRNRGTLGGSLAHADPAAELPAVMVALGARFKLTRQAGERWVEASDFFSGLFATALEPDEILTEVVVPPTTPGTGVSFVEVARRAGDYALVGLATSVHLDAEGRIDDLRLVFLSVGDGPVAVRAAHEVLSRRPSAQLVDELCAAIRSEVQPADDIHASADYRRHLAAVLTRRTLALALANTTSGESK
jgi:carbon-monoxide dehydrogenase medium subunit